MMAGPEKSSLFAALGNIIWDGNNSIALEKLITEHRSFVEVTRLILKKLAYVNGSRLHESNR
jgi:hypothetical protein